MKTRVKLLALLFILTLVASSCWWPQKQHVILFISDGTQLEHMIAGSRYLTGKDNGLVFQKGFDYEGYVTTWDVTVYNRYLADLGIGGNYDESNVMPTVGYDPALGGWAPYPICYTPTQDTYFPFPYGWDPDNGLYGHLHRSTDSASSASAMASGRKTVDGNINWLPGDAVGGDVPHISEILREQRGFAIGSCSTVPYTHATPIAFMAHNVKRSNYIAMGNEVLNDFKPEVTIGGGYPDPSYALLPTPIDPYTYINADQITALENSEDYVFVQRIIGQADARKRLMKAADEAVKKNKKLFGLFGSHAKGVFSHNFDPPVPKDCPGNPGFTYNKENPSLADVVEATFKVLKQDEDGFFVMFEQGDADWSNHMDDYYWMIGTMHDLNEAVKKAIDLVNKPGDDMDWSNTTLIVTADHANGYMRLDPVNKLGKGDLPPDNPADTNDLANWLGEFTYSPEFTKYVTYGNIRWHTNEPVMLWAKGNKAKTFRKYESQLYPGTKLIDNTDIFKVIAEITDVDID